MATAAELRAEADHLAGERMVPSGKRQLKALFVAMAMTILAFVVTWWTH